MNTTRDSIDEQLGESVGRYFGLGFSTVTHALKTESYSRDSLTALVSVGYPSSWSVKNGVTRTAHLTSIDAIALGMRLAFKLVTHAFAISTADMPYLWASGCRLSPGPTPQYNLSQFEANVRIIDLDSALAAGLVTVSCRLGSFQVTIDVVLGSGPPQSQMVRGIYAEQADLPYYTDGYKEVFRHLGQVESVNGSFQAMAQLGQIGVDGRTGCESGLTFIDAGIFCAQVAQVAMYAQDGLSRTETGNTWLRAATFRQTGEARWHRFEGTCEVTLTRTKLLERSLRMWRCSEFLGRIGDIEVNFSLAHEISAERENA
ncbi:AvrD family protein [Glutamicibacter arilaitensis]|uniref:AvrD family protein n=1 Tax=Glutamicibacter arilaitensis TaxID=256701 RepID=UPI003FD28E70